MSFWNFIDTEWQKFLTNEFSERYSILWGELYSKFNEYFLGDKKENEMFTQHYGRYYSDYLLSKAKEWGYRTHIFPGIAAPEDLMVEKTRILSS